MRARPAVNMRVRGSDARLYRAVNVPTVVYGPTPYHMGAADEFARLDEPGIMTRVHALTALDFLNA